MKGSQLVKQKPKLTFEKGPPVAKKAKVENIKAKEKKAKAEIKASVSEYLSSEEWAKKFGSYRSFDEAEMGMANMLPELEPKVADDNEYPAPADVVVWPEKPMRIPDNVPDAVLFAAAAARKATLRETRGKYATIKSQVQCPYCAFGPLGVRELRRHKRTCKANPRTLHPRGPGKFAPGFASKEDVHIFLKQSGWSKGDMSVIPGLGSGVQKGQQWNHPVHGKLWVGGEKFYHQPHHMAGTPVSNKIFWKQTTDPKKQPVDIQKMFPSGKPPAAAPVDLNKLGYSARSFDPGQLLSRRGGAAIKRRAR